MSKLAPEQQQLLQMLRGVYQEIYAIEEALNLRISQKDSRVRVDYFYDAPRALTDDSMALDWRRQRLSVQWLAYDAVAIRYLEHRPGAALKPNDQHYSASAHLIVTDPKLPNKGRRISRDDKRELKQCYLRFGVLFVALFKPFADRDHKDKQEEMEEQLSVLAELEKNVEALALGGDSKADIKQLLAMVDDPKLKAKLELLLADQRYHNPDAMREAMSVAGGGVEQQDRSLQTMEKAHMEFLTAQLGLYEHGKDYVKQLAGQGLNVAGQHFEQAMAQSADLGIGR